MASGFVVSARKYRPGTFADVVGQEHVANTLRNGLKQDQLGHAFLFTGPRGVGKTTCARILAKAINCQNLTETGDPCNACDSCRNFNEGRSLNIFELDAASNNSVEDIRQLIERLRYVPQGGAKSVYIIDEVHMLSTAAFNAFLKTLEEPPPHALFILATTEKHKILPTILSRCQKFDFRRIQVDDIAQRLQWICEEEHIEAEYDALQLIGLKADGALRDALSIFDQIVNFSGGHLTYQSVLENLNVLDYEYYFRLVHCMAAEDHPQALLLLNEVIHKGFEPINFLMGLVEHFRNLLVAYEPGTVALLETSDGVKQRYLEQSQLLPPNVLLNAFNLASEAEQKIRSATLPRLTVELLLLKLTHLPQVLSLATLPETDGQKKKVAKPELAPPVAATTAATIPAPSVQPAYTATPSGDGPGSVPQVEAHPAAYT
ncbi:MAG: DNA polymerase III subunit gamma/tau, partial [Sphingobacteriia bacterium]